jgi:hypothetical protein
VRPGDVIVLHKIQEQEQIMKKNDKGGMTSERRLLGEPCG